MIIISNCIYLHKHIAFIYLYIKVYILNHKNPTILTYCAWNQKYNLRASANFFIMNFDSINFFKITWHFCYPKKSDRLYFLRFFSVSFNHAPQVRVRMQGMLSCVRVREGLCFSRASRILKRHLIFFYIYLYTNISIACQ